MAEKQENTVILVGNLENISPVGEQAGEGVVSITEMYASGKQVSTQVLVRFPDRKLVEEMLNKAKQHGKTLYVSVLGFLANRKFNESDRYANHVYVVASKVGPANVASPSQFSRAYFQGEVISSKERFTSSGKPFVNMLVRNSRTIYNRETKQPVEISSAVNVSAFGEDSVNKMMGIGNARAKILVIGSLSSFERNGVPQVNITAETLIIEGPTAQKEESEALVVSDDDVDDGEESLEDIFAGI